MKRFWQRLSVRLTTEQGKNMLTFSIFVAISFFFWLLMTLNDDVEREYNVKVVINDVPEDINFITEAPSTILVTVNGKGSSLARYSLGGAPKLEVSFSELTQLTPNTAVMSRGSLRKAVRRLFVDDLSILSVMPDSFKITYTTAPGVRVPVKADLQASSAPNHIIFGATRLSVDSVTVYSVAGHSLADLTVVTQPINLSELKDSTTVTVDLIAPDGARVDPSKIEVTVPVEPLVARTRTVEIEPIHVPAGYQLSTFPSTVELTVMMPMSRYSVDNAPVKIYADYNTAHDNTVGLTLSILPDYYRNPLLSTNRVEYVIEKRH